MVIVTNTKRKVSADEKTRLIDALRAYDSCGRHGRGASIGTLGEKTLHGVLKYYYEPDPERHEVAVGDYVADIVGENGVIEIQTRSLAPIRAKLMGLAELCRVTVVHPVIVSKRITVIDAGTGEAVSSRMSPKHGSVYSEVRSIYPVRELLADGSVALRLPLLTADELRLTGVRTNRRKKQRGRAGEYISDLRPTGIAGEIVLSEPSDYAALLPEGLPEVFGSQEFAAAARTDIQSARMTLNLLTATGQVLRSGRDGKRLIFRLSGKD